MNLNKLPNLVIFTGEERVDLQDALRKLKAKPISDLNQLQGLMTAGNLFNANSTYVVDDKRILKWEPDKLKRLTKTNRLIIVADKLDKRSKLVKAIEVVEFKRGSTNKLTKLVAGKLNIGEDLAGIIVQCCEHDKARILNECDKLSHVQEPLTFDVVTDLIHLPPEDAIFEMIDSIVNRETERAYDLYRDMVELGESPIKIISLLYNKVKQVFIVQTAGTTNLKAISDMTGLGYWQVKQSVKLVNIFSDWGLISLLKRIHKSEVNMKTGLVPIDVEMEDLLITILRG